MREDAKTRGEFAEYGSVIKNFAPLRLGEEKKYRAKTLRRGVIKNFVPLGKDIEIVSLISRNPDS